MSNSFSSQRLLHSIVTIKAVRTADRHALAVGRGFTALMREAQLVTLAAIRVVDAHGVVVASTGGELGLSLPRMKK